jgi:hypothetical protein
MQVGKCCVAVYEGSAGEIETIRGVKEEFISSSIRAASFFISGISSAGDGTMHRSHFTGDGKTDCLVSLVFDQEHYRSRSTHFHKRSCHPHFTSINVGVAILACSNSSFFYRSAFQYNFTSEVLCILLPFAGLHQIEFHPGCRHQS